MNFSLYLLFVTCLFFDYFSKFAPEILNRNLKINVSGKI